MNIVCFKELRVRILLLMCVLFVTLGMYGDGFTPTDGGFVVKLQRGQSILLSTMIDDDNNAETPDVEYFVCHYPSYTEGTEKPSVESLVLKKWHICGKKLAYVLFFLYLCGIFEK